jgi:hypothetical protein
MIILFLAIMIRILILSMNLHILVLFSLQMVLFVKIKRNWSVKLEKPCIVFLIRVENYACQLTYRLRCLTQFSVKPILMYGCEVWGFANSSVIESFCLQFYKSILGLEKNTPNCVLYGELGRFSIDIEIKSRISVRELFVINGVRPIIRQSDSPTVR